MSPMPSPAPISREPLRIEICKDEDDLARRAAGLFVAEAARALGARRQFTVALSGGETPRRMYALLSQDNYAFQVVWPAVQVFWSDERCVAPDDPRSNYGCARDALLSKLSIPPENIHRMRGEDDPARAAASYEGVLREHFHGMPRFDLILLGIGSDGHTASLFPGSAAAAETQSWVVATQDPEGAPRLSLTVPVLNAAETIAVLVTGAGKAEIARKVLGTEGRAEGLPIQKVRPTSGQLAWILDEAAASLLEPQAGD